MADVNPPTDFIEINQSRTNESLIDVYKDESILYGIALNQVS